MAGLLCDRPLGDQDQEGVRAPEWEGVRTPEEVEDQQTGGQETDGF